MDKREPKCTLQWLCNKKYMTIGEVKSISGPVLEPDKLIDAPQIRLPISRQIMDWIATRCGYHRKHNPNEYPIDHWRRAATTYIDSDGEVVFEITLAKKGLKRIENIFTLGRIKFRCFMGDKKWTFTGCITGYEPTDNAVSVLSIKVIGNMKGL